MWSVSGESPEHWLVSRRVASDAGAGVSCRPRPDSGAPPVGDCLLICFGRPRPPSRLPCEKIVVIAKKPGERMTVVVEFPRGNKIGIGMHPDSPYCS